jgi:hypothetical protein
MPINIPARYQRRERLPSALGGARDSGAGKAALNRAIVNAGKAVEHRALELKKERDIAISEAAYGEFQDAARELMYNEEDGLLLKKGESIYNLDGEYKEWFNKLHGKFMENRFDTDTQANRFNGLVQDEAQRNLDSISKYIRTEHDRNKKNAEDGRILRSTKEIEGDPFNDEKRKRLIKEANQFLTDLHPGQPDFVAIHSAAATEAINSAAITTISNTHPWLAYRKIKTMEKEFSPEKYKQLTSGILSNITRLDNIADEMEKERLAEGDYNAWISFRKGEITEQSQLDVMADGRLISKEGYNGLSNALIQKDGKGPEHNNWRVMGEISEKIGMGINQSKELDKAMARGHAKVETYLSWKKEGGNKENQKGMRRINDILKPSAADKWKPDLNARHGEAMDRYEDLKLQNYSPEEAADKVIDEYSAELRRTVAGLPTPSFLLTGDKLDPAALANAKERTIAAFKRGGLARGELEYQMQLIEDLLKLSSESRRVQSITEEEKKRIKR